MQFDGGRNSHLVTDVSAPGGMDYAFLKKNLPFQSIAGQVVFTEDRMWLNELHGDIFGGEATGGLDLALGHAKDYTASIDVKNLDFARLTKLYFDYDTSKGELSGDYRFTGTSDDARTLHGMGTLERGSRQRVCHPVHGSALDGHRQRAAGSGVRRGASGDARIS